MYNNRSLTLDHSGLLWNVFSEVNLTIKFNRYKELHQTTKYRSNLWLLL